MVERLRAMRERNYLFYYDEADVILELYDYTKHLEDDVLAGGDRAQIEEWRELRAQFFDTIGDLLASDAEERLLADVSAALESDELDESLRGDYAFVLEDAQRLYRRSRELLRRFRRQPRGAPRGDPRQFHHHRPRGNVHDRCWRDAFRRRVHERRYPRLAREHDPRAELPRRYTVAGLARGDVRARRARDARDQQPRSHAEPADRLRARSCSSGRDRHVPFDRSLREHGHAARRRLPHLHRAHGDQVRAREPAEARDPKRLRALHVRGGRRAGHRGPDEARARRA